MSISIKWLLTISTLLSTTKITRTLVLLSSASVFFFFRIFRTPMTFSLATNNFSVYDSQALWTISYHSMYYSSIHSTLISNHYTACCIIILDCAESVTDTIVVYNQNHALQQLDILISYTYEKQKRISVYWTSLLHILRYVRSCMIKFIPSLIHVFIVSWFHGIAFLMGRRRPTIIFFSRFQFFSFYRVFIFIIHFFILLFAT